MEVSASPIFPSYNDHNAQAFMATAIWILTWQPNILNKSFLHLDAATLQNENRYLTYSSNHHVHNIHGQTVFPIPRLRSVMGNNQQ